jgi:hypothetical protein
VLDLRKQLVGDAFGLFVDEIADSIEEWSDVVRHREPLSKARDRDSMGRSAYLWVHRSYPIVK